VYKYQPPSIQTITSTAPYTSVSEPICRHRHHSQRARFLLLIWALYTLGALGWLAYRSALAGFLCTTS
jgi:hypothetical protein